MSEKWGEAFRRPKTTCARVKRQRFGANVAFAHTCGAKRWNVQYYTFFTQLTIFDERVFKTIFNLNCSEISVNAPIVNNA